LLPNTFSHLKQSAFTLDDTYTELDDAGNVIEKKIQTGLDDAGEPEFQQRQEAHVVLYVDGKTDGRFVNGSNAVIDRNYVATHDRNYGATV